MFGQQNGLIDSEEVPLQLAGPRRQNLKLTLKENWVLIAACKRLFHMIDSI